MAVKIIKAFKKGCQICMRIPMQLPQQGGDGLQVVQAGVAGGSLASST